MKLKTRLIVAFCIITMMPIMMFCIIAQLFLYPQWKGLSNTYQMEDEVSGFAGASLRIVSAMADQLETLVRYEVDEDAEQFNDSDFLKELNRKFKEKNSYLVIWLGDECKYVGMADSELDSVYAALKYEKNDYSFAEKYGQVFRRVLFTLKDGTVCQAYIFTDVDNMIPEIKNMIWLVLETVLLILVLTGTLVVIWLYRSMIRPVNSMRCAAQNIRDGNLDFDMKIPRDELGELAGDIDEMRRRLKSSAEEKVLQDELSRQMISNISHDLKTPITTIKGYAEGLLDGIAATPEKQAKYLKTIISKSDDMTRLIEELTLYSRIDSGTVPYSFEKIEVKEYFEDFEYDVKNELEAEGIDFTYSNYAPADTRIMADPEQMKRVLNNIVSNSVKYMHKSERWIALRISGKNGILSIELEDNGDGIAEKDVGRIFDRFFRTDASRHGPSNGSGIGLAIVKKIVEDHKGKVYATSKEQVGTVMHIELPIIKEEKQ